MARVLVVDDQANAVAALKELLHADGHVVQVFTESRDAVYALTRGTFDIVLSGLELTQADGEELVRVAREHQPRACILVCAARTPAAFGSACRVFGKPLDYEAFRLALAGCELSGCARSGRGEPAIGAGGFGR